MERVACERLGLMPEPAATQVVPRDRLAALLSALALCAASLERFATEVRHLARTEVGEVQEPFGTDQKGSSAMPHKRNPVVAERICGLARVIRAAAAVGLENVPLWHERDISHSSVDRMRANLESSHGLVFSQRVLSALVGSGLGRDEAYRLVQRHALRSWDEGLSFQELVEGDPEIGPRLDPSVFDLGDALKHVDVLFERLAALTVRKEEAVHA
jgi:adenylosuccinate lyase